MNLFKILLMASSMLQASLESDVEVVTPVSMTARFGTDSIVTKVIQKSQNAICVRTLESFITPTTVKCRGCFIRASKAFLTVLLSCLWLGMFNSANRRRSHQSTPPVRGTGSRRFTAANAPLPSVGELSLPTPGVAGRRMARVSSVNRRVVVRPTDIDAALPEVPSMPPAISAGVFRAPSGQLEQPDTPMGNFRSGHDRQTVSPSSPYDQQPTTPGGSMMRNVQSMGNRIIPSGENKWNLFERLITHGFIYYQIVSILFDKIFKPQALEIAAYDAIVRHIRDGKTLELPGNKLLMDLILSIWTAQDCLPADEKAFIIILMKNALQGIALRGDNDETMMFTNGEFFSREGAVL